MENEKKFAQPEAIIIKFSESDIYTDIIQTSDVGGENAGTIPEWPQQG